MVVLNVSKTLGVGRLGSLVAFNLMVPLKIRDFQVNKSPYFFSI